VNILVNAEERRQFGVCDLLGSLLRE